MQEWYNKLGNVYYEKRDYENASKKIKAVKYDLVILGYQPWFLSPSIPTTSLLEDA